MNNQSTTGKTSRTSRTVKSKIWYEDPIAFLMDVEDAARILPSKSMTLTEQLNAAFRFALYFSIVVLVVKRDANVFFFAIFVGLLTIVIYNHDKSVNNNKSVILEKLNMGSSPTQKHCVLPTRDNPFMNVLYTDYADFPNRPGACNPMSTKAKTAIRKNYEKGTVRDVDDIFGKNSGERQFYTTAITTIPNDQSGFANWLYKSPPTCKERSMSCMPR